jgi:GTP-binding protein EngB required for normal cell division
MVREISEYVKSNKLEISIFLHEKSELGIFYTKIDKNRIEVLDETNMCEYLEEFIAKCIYIYGHFDKFSSSNEVCSTSTSSSTSLFSSTVSSEPSIIGESVSHSEHGDSHS